MSDASNVDDHFRCKNCGWDAWVRTAHYKEIVLVDEGGDYVETAENEFIQAESRIQCDNCGLSPYDTPDTQ